MSRSQTTFFRRVIAGCIVGALSFLLAVLYAKMIKPAFAREINAACTGLRSSSSNPSFGELPSSQPVDFVAQDYQGRPVRLSDYRGKIVFVNFWATWCGVCKSEKPGMEAMSAALGGDDFVVLTLASDPSWDKIREHFPNGSPLNILLDPPAEGDNLGVIAKSFGITAVPESFVIDRQGRVRYYYINKRDWDSSVARTCLRSVIAE